MIVKLYVHVIMKYTFKKKCFFDLIPIQFKIYQLYNLTIK